MTRKEILELGARSLYRVPGATGSVSLVFSMWILDLDRRHSGPDPQLHWKMLRATKKSKQYKNNINDVFGQK